MFSAERLPYQQTNAFSKIVIDYLEGNDELQPFYSHAPDIDGIKAAIEAKRKQQVDRNLLVEVLRQQYATVDKNKVVEDNIELLLKENVFTVCTAHQPNLFTGPLYFIYKIAHAIKLADFLSKEVPECKFVPVFYMGCEDADLEELSHFTVFGKRYTWQTKQKGAVGRMRVDKQLLQIIEELQQQLSVFPFGDAWMQLLKTCFRKEKSIQEATFELVHMLFGDFGLITLIPDNASFKKQIKNVFATDFFEGTPLQIVTETSQRLNKKYNAQAHARVINSFYLRDDVRERIERKNEAYIVLHTDYKFSEDKLKTELQDHPERFSPNVILRGLLQETILPDDAFIGGGGELAYWLQLKDLFDHFNVPFPPLVLRNSFMIIDRQQQQVMSKLALATAELFQSELDLLNRMIERAGNKPVLNGELDEIRTKYDRLKQIANAYDPTLLQHVEALKVKTVHHLEELEKKMARAERKKYSATERQIRKLKQQLFPNNNLQERVENAGSYFAKWGPDFIKEIVQQSRSLEQQFVILKDSKAVVD